MFKGFGRLASCAALVAATLAPMAAHAVIIDFNDPTLTGAYFDGDTFTQNGFVMKQEYDPGSVDTAALGFTNQAIAPTGNLTQFYFNSNEGDLVVSAANGLAFSLAGFKAAFVPGATAPSGQIGLVAYATTMTGTTFGTLFSLGTTSSITQGSPFLTFSSAADFGRFTNLASVTFFACVLTACSDPHDSGQFALDDIVVNQATVTPVPEPETYALMVAGLLAIGAVRRRRVR